jgi:type IV secretory pathway ATPase VirB11/archaellum biosynthesis ATPase
MLHQLKISKKMNKNEETKSLMIGNVPELVEAGRSAVVVGEVATATTEFLAAAPFAIHVAM